MERELESVSQAVAASTVGSTCLGDGDDGLKLENFVPVGVRGVTDQRNSYAQGMAWFNGRLYVGMTRDSLCLLKRPVRKLAPPKMEFWPVQCPECDTPELWRGQILTFDPVGGTWEMVYESPLMEENGKQVMRDVGYRGMVVHHGGREKRPSLYVGTMSGSGALILRSEDGVVFDSLPVRLGSATSIRSLVSFKGKLYAAILGKSGHHPNESEHTEVFEIEDPVKGKWRAVSLPGFGDPANTAVFELGKFNGFLYAATMNPVSGFELWKTDGEGRPPYRWKKVITAGAYRGFLNQYGMCLVEHGGCLYVGTGISGGGYDQVYKTGPAPSELLRVFPDDSWDVVVGTPRITPVGTKLPISGMIAGFNNFLNGYTWRMCSHDGWLYVGTMNSAAFIPFKPYYVQRVADAKFRAFEKLLPTGEFNEFVAQYGGCHLWRTNDGEHWQPVTRNGFGTSYNIGIRQMASTPHGLFVGTANPFGPMVGVKKDGVWRYEENPRGGAEIWLGSARMNNKRGKGSRSRQEQYSHSVLRLGQQIELMIYYLMTEEFYENSDFRHVGYWSTGARSAPEACGAMMEMLLSCLPEIRGPVLDVGCGKGATTRHLLRHLDPSEIVGIDESQWLIDFALERKTGIRFLAMNPARMQFPDESFEVVMSAEAAYYFNTRLDFLKEARRVLRPGGRLVYSDMIFSRESYVASRGKLRANYIAGMDSYVALLVKAGFAEEDIRITDLTNDTLGPYIEIFSEYMKHKYRANEITEGKYNVVMLYISRMCLFAKNYLLVSAVKRPAPYIRR